MAGVEEDPFEDEGWKAYADHVREVLIPMIDQSAITMALISDAKPDPKQAVELGYMILLDKPIIAVVAKGSKCPNKLVLCADEIIEGDLGDPSMGKRIQEAAVRVMKKREVDDIEGRKK